MTEDPRFHMQGFLQSYFWQHLTFSVITNFNFAFNIMEIFKEKT